MPGQTPGLFFFFSDRADLNRFGGCGIGKGFRQSFPVSLW